MLGTFGGALEARQIDASNGKLTAEVTGEVETEDNVLVIRRIHVEMRLVADPELKDKIDGLFCRASSRAILAEGRTERRSCPATVKPAGRGTSVGHQRTGAHARSAHLRCTHADTALHLMKWNRTESSHGRKCSEGSPAARSGTTFNAAAATYRCATPAPDVIFHASNRGTRLNNRTRRHRTGD